MGLFSLFQRALIMPRIGDGGRLGVPAPKQYERTLPPFQADMKPESQQDQTANLSKLIAQGPRISSLPGYSTASGTAVVVPAGKLVMFRSVPGPASVGGIAAIAGALRGESYSIDRLVWQQIYSGIVVVPVNNQIFVRSLSSTGDADIMFIDPAYAQIHQANMAMLASQVQTAHAALTLSDTDTGATPLTSTLSLGALGSNKNLYCTAISARVSTAGTGTVTVTLSESGSTILVRTLDASSLDSSFSVEFGYPGVANSTPWNSAPTFVLTATGGAGAIQVEQTILGYAL